MDIHKKLPFVAAAAEYMIEHKTKLLSVSSFGGVWDKDGKGTPMAWGQNYACHATMSEMDNLKGYYGAAAGFTALPPSKKPEVVFSWSKAGPGGYTDPEFMAWTKWLVSPESPYRSLWARTPEEGVWVQTKSGLVDVTSDEFCRDFGFIFFDLDVPANLLVNFMIQARQHKEHPQIVESWHKLVTAGADPTLAVIFAHQLPKVGPVNEISLLGDPSHCAIDTWGSVSPERISNFCRGVIGSPNLNYSEAEVYYPCNAVFETKGWRGYNNPGSYYQFIVNQYKNRFIDGGGTRMFNTGKVPAKSMTLENLVTVINTEAKRIANDA